MLKPPLRDAGMSPFAPRKVALSRSERRSCDDLERRGVVWPVRRLVVGLASVALAVAALAAEQRPSTSTTPQAKTRQAESPQKELLAGKVVLVADALKRRGIEVGEEMAQQAALETAEGELIPIAADWRGRAFFQDKRLRDRKVELVGFRRRGVPYLQILIVYMFDQAGARQEVDYWCDTCAIPQYELKMCECCQEPIRLRLRPAELPDYLR